MAARRPQWPRGFLARSAAKAVGDGLRALEILRLAGQQVQRRQVGDHHGVGVGGGVVVGAAHAHDDVGGVVGGEGVAAGVGDPEVRLERGAPALGGGEAGRIVGGLIEAQRGPDHVGVVAGVALHLGLAGAIGVGEAAVRLHALADEIEGGGRGFQPIGAVEHACGMGERGDHQAVPVGQHLVVPAGADAILRAAPGACCACRPAPPPRRASAGRDCAGG